MNTLYIALLAVLALISVESWAQSRRSDDPMKNTKNVYEQLEDIFPISQGIGKEQDRQILDGWFSGRCYQSASQEIARNHLRVGWFDFSGNGQDVYRSLSVRRGDGTNGGPDFFDHLSPPEKADLQQYLNSPFGKVTADVAQFSDGSVIAKYNSNYAEHVFVHRKFLHFIVSKWYKNGDLYGYCYSFKKVN